MRTKKKSSGKIPEKKSAVPYKSAAPHRHKPSDSQTAEIADAIQTNRGASGSAAYKIS